MIGDYLKTLRCFSRNVCLYLVTSALVGFCWIGVFAVLFNLYLLRLRYDLAFVGLVNGTAALVYAVACLPGGVLGGRWGIRRTMVLGLCVSVAGLGLSALAEVVAPTIRGGWLVFSYSLAWVGASLYIVNANPFLMGSTGQERDYVFAMQVAAWPLAGAAGNLVGGLLPGACARLLRIPLDNPACYRYPLLLATLLYILTIPVLWVTRDVETVDTEEQAEKRDPAPYNLIVLMSLVVLLQVAGEAVARTFFNVYLDSSLHVATHQIGTLTAIGRLLSVPAALLAPLLMARWGKAWSFIGSSIGMVLFLLPLALMRHPIAAALGFAGVMALASVARPAITVYQQESVSSTWQAVMSGATTMGVGLSMGTMSLVGGHIATVLSYRTLFLTGAGVTLAGVLLFWGTLKNFDPAGGSNTTSKPASRRS